MVLEDKLNLDLWLIQLRVLLLMLQLIKLFLDVSVDDVDNNADSSVVDAIGHSTVGSVVE